MPEWSVRTPIDTFENPTTGSLIDIVSTVHVGLPSYYRSLGRRIVSRQDEGYSVHYETISSSDDCTPTGLIEKMKFRLHDATSDASADSLIAVELSSTYTLQDDDELFRTEEATNYDITGAEYTRAVGLGLHAMRLVRSRARRSSLQKIAKEKKTEDLDEHVFTLIRKDVAQHKNGSKRRREWGDSITIDRRNDIALQGVDNVLETDSESKLVVVWGLGHLAGLSAGLVSRGYEHTGRKEVEAAYSHTIFQKELEARQKALREFLNSQA